MDGGLRCGIYIINPVEIADCIAFMILVYERRWTVVAYYISCGALLHFHSQFSDDEMNRYFGGGLDPNLPCFHQSWFGQLTCKAAAIIIATKSAPCVQPWSVENGAHNTGWHHLHQEISALQAHYGRSNEIQWQDRRVVLDYLSKDRCIMKTEYEEWWQAFQFDSWDIVHERIYGLRPILKHFRRLASQFWGSCLSFVVSLLIKHQADIKRTMKTYLAELKHSLPSLIRNGWSRA